MGDLAELQRNAARLATNADARAVAEAGPEGLDRFAAALIQKRLKAVRELLPRSFALFGGELDQRFRDWAAARPSRSPHRHRRDAVRFAQTLHHDLAHYEAAGVEAWLGGVPKLELFRLRVDRPGADLERGATLILWLRLPRGRLRRVRLWPLT